MMRGLRTFSAARLILACRGQLFDVGLRGVLRSPRKATWKRASRWRQSAAPALSAATAAKISASRSPTSTNTSPSALPATCAARSPTRVPRHHHVQLRRLRQPPRRTHRRRRPTQKPRLRPMLPPNPRAAIETSRADGGTAEPHAGSRRDRRALTKDAPPSEATTSGPGPDSRIAIHLMMQAIKAVP